MLFSKMPLCKASRKLLMQRRVFYGAVFCIWGAGGPFVGSLWHLGIDGGGGCFGAVSRCDGFQDAYLRLLWRLE